MLNVLSRENGFDCIRHLGREVKAADSKSAGLCPREFESHRCRASMAQLAERSAVNRQVPGSIPGGGVFNGGILGAFIGFSATKCMGAPVAQMVERKTLNLVVVGSSPTGGGFFCFL